MEQKGSNKVATGRQKSHERAEKQSKRDKRKQ